MIRALHLRSSFNPGGTETLLLNLFNHKQTDIQLFYFLLSDGTYINKLNSSTNSYFKKFRKSKFDLSFIPSIIRLINKYQITIIHTHQPIELVYGTIIRLFIPGLKHFHSIHLYNSSTDWKFYLEKFLVKFTSKTITVSESLRQKLIKRGYNIKKLAVLYNAVIVDKSNSRKESQNKIKFEKIIKYKKDNDLIIGMIGNFVPEKDQLTLIKAYSKILKEQLPQLKLVFIGKTSENSKVCYNELDPDVIGNKVFFTGAVESANQYLDYFDLVVMSSKSETFGIVIVEALLKKIPVLASDIDAFCELSNNGKYFSLFKTGDEEDLANKIINNFKKEKDTFSRQIECSNKYAKNQFSYKKFVAELLQIYNN